MAARMAMIAMTTNNSISVKAFPVFFIVQIGLMPDNLPYLGRAHHPQYCLCALFRTPDDLRGSRLERDQFTQLGIVENFFQRKFCFATPIGAFGGGAGNVLRTFFEPQVFE